MIIRYSQYMTENEPFILKSHRFEVNNMKGSDTYVILTSEYLAGDRVQRYDEKQKYFTERVLTRG